LIGKVDDGSTPRMRVPAMTAESLDFGSVVLPYYKQGINKTR